MDIDTKDFTIEKVDEVVLNPKVVLQIIKHAQDDNRSSEDGLYGYLTGQTFEEKGTTEITNCFRTLYNQDVENYHHTNQEYQKNMLKCLREENQDYIIVGHYKIIANFNFLTKAEDFEALMKFQRDNDTNSCHGTVILVYDPLRMSNGDFGIRAFRVSEKGMTAYTEYLNSDASSTKGNWPFSVTAVNSHKIDFTDILEEVPITIKSSYLMNCLLLQIENARVEDLKKNTNGTLKSQIVRNKLGDKLMAPSYTMACGSNLLNQTELMKRSVEEISADTTKFLKSQKELLNATRNKASLLSTMDSENEKKKSNGEKTSDIDKATLEEINKRVKMPDEYNRLPGLVYSYQASLFCDSVKNISAGNVGKLFVAESMQDQ